MAQAVVPWWIGFGLASPFRRVFWRPEVILSPYVTPGMTILEPGPGMGFFTLTLARMASPSGRVVCIDIQKQMLEELARRTRSAGLADRVDLRLTDGASGMPIGDLEGRVDFALAFAMVHEVPDPGRFFREVSRALKTGGRLLFCEPRWHVRTSAFLRSLEHAREAGFRPGNEPGLAWLRSALLTKP